MINNKTKMIYTCLCLIATVFTLLLWSESPIYPDEIAQRIVRWSFGSTQTALLRLDSLCKGSITAIPLLFILPAKMLNFLNHVLSVTEARIIPFILVIMLACVAAWYALKGAKPAWLVLMLCAAYIGVAGSSLIMYRSETAIYFNIIVCIFSAIVVTRENSSLMLRVLSLIALIFSCLLSAFYHPQGILYLPLSAFIAFCLLPGTASRRTTVIKTVACTIPFAYIAVEGLKLLTVNCDNHPALDKARKVLAPGLLEWVHSIDFNLIPYYLFVRCERYAQAFTYHKHYDIDYLPGVKRTNLLNIVNISIDIVLIATFILVGMTVICLTNKSFTDAFKHRKYQIKEHFDTVIYYLILLPTVFILFYNPTMNFYRSHFIHFMLVIALMIGMIQIRNKKIIYVFKVYTILSLIVFITTSGINYKKFYPNLRQYADPSTPILSYKRSAKDIEKISKVCMHGEQDGSIVIDDLTYDSYRTWNRIYPITYLNLQIAITGLTAPQLLELLKPNYIIARCGSLEFAKVGLPADDRVGDICCTVLNK